MSTKEPKLQDFGITAHEYAVFTGSWKYSQDRAVFFGIIVIGLVVALVVFAVTQEIGYALGLGIVSIFPGAIVTGGIVQYLVEAFGRFNKHLLLEDPVANKVKLYEEAQAAYQKAQWEAERVQREAEAERLKVERVLRKAETARLKVERTRRRKFEDYWMSLSGTDFERELATVLRGLGYRVKSTPSSEPVPD